MTPKRRTEINGLAKTILEGLELQVPVELETAVSRLGGKLRLESQMAGRMEALIRKSEERFEIVLSDSKPETRRRFSIAHELGHLFLHMGYLLDPDTWASTEDYRDAVYYRFGHSVEELEANEFAAAFLMPQEEFESVVKSCTKNGKCSIERVGNHFKTSREAVMRRGQSLKLF